MTTWARETYQKIKKITMATALTNRDLVDSGLNLDDKESKAEALDYKVNMPKPIEVNAADVLNSFDHLYNYLSSRNDAFLATDNFQRRYLYELPKLLWQTEKLEDLGDFVLLFPNPDKVDETQANIGISFEEAEENFRNIFETNYTYPYKKKFMTSLKEAYETAFTHLPDMKTEEQIEEEDQQNAIKAEKNIAAETNTTRVENKVATDSLEDKALLNTSSRLPVHGTKNSEEVEVNQKADNKQEEDVKVTKQGKDNKATKGNAKESAKQKVKKKEVNKKLVYAQKSDEADEEKIDLKDTTDSMDYITLLRKTTQAVLANHGFITRQFVTKENNQIAVVITLPEQNVKKVAMEMGIVKAMEFSMSDLPSLEPVDRKYRPLRLSEYLIDRDIWDKSYTLHKSEKERREIGHLRDDILDLLTNECNMKNIIRMCNGIWQEPSNVTHTSIHDHAYVPLQVWRMYRDYLFELAMHIQLIKQNIRMFKKMLEVFYDLNGNMVSRGNHNRKLLDLQDIARFTCHEVYKAFEKAKKNANNRGDYAQQLEEPSGESGHFEVQPSKTDEDDGGEKNLLNKKSRENKTSNRRKLMNIWDYLKISKVEHRHPYEGSNSKMRPRTKFFFESLWKYYIGYAEVDVRQKTDPKAARKSARDHMMDRSVTGMYGTIMAPADNQVARQFQVKRIYYSQFTKVERLKAVNFLINKVLNVKELSDCFLNLSPLAITNALSVVLMKSDSILFPLHDRKKLLGKDYSKIFRRIKQLKINYGKLDALKKSVEIRYELASKIDHGESDASQLLVKVNPVKKPAKNVVIDPTVDGGVNVRTIKTITRRPGRKSISPFTKEINVIKQDYMAEENNENKKDKIIQYQMFFVASTLTPSYMTPILKDAYQLINSTKKSDSKENHNGIDKTKSKSKNRRELVEKLAEMMAELEGYYLMTSLKDSAQELIKILRSQLPLREKFPSFFINRTLGDYEDNSEAQVKYPLSQTLRMTTWNNLSRFEERTMREYFGEKITLYFAFACHFKDWLVIPAILAMLSQVVEIYYQSSEYFLTANELPAIVFKATSIIFVMSISVLKNFFLSKWEQYERKFALRYGMNNLEEAKTIRNRFEGCVARSLITDKQNDLIEDSKKSKLQFVLSMVCFSLVVIFSMGVCYTIVQIKRIFNTNYDAKDITVPGINMKLMELTFNGAELTRILVLERIFLSVVQKIVGWQNLKYVEDHEQQVVVYMCCFQLINKSCYLVLLSYDQFLVEIKRYGPNAQGVETFSVTNKNCNYSSCYIEIANFFMCYNIFEFFWVVFYDLGIRYVLRRFSPLKLAEKLKKSLNFIGKRKGIKKARGKIITKKEVEEIGDSDESKENEEEKDKRKATCDNIVSTFYTQQKKLYEEIDSEIEHQIVSLDDYNEVGDIDKSLYNYQKIVNNFTFIMLFGPISSFSYLFAWLISVINYHLRREELLYETKRPNPVTANSIGLWFSMVKFVSFMSVFTNSLYVAILVFQDLDSDKRILLFLLMVVILGVLDFTLRRFMGNPSRNYLFAANRLAFVQNLVFSSSGPTKSAKHKASVNIDFHTFKNEVKTQNDSWEDLVEKIESAKEKKEGSQSKIVIKELYKNYLANQKIQQTKRYAQSFVTFSKTKYMSSNTNLSLEALPENEK